MQTGKHKQKKESRKIYVKTICTIRRQSTMIEVSVSQQHLTKS